MYWSSILCTISCNTVSVWSISQCCAKQLCYSLLFFFFFKQKTAYEMRISDWSSDVCSSDLPFYPPPRINHHELDMVASLFKHGALQTRSEERRVGKSVSVRVDLGGRRIIKKKKITKNTQQTRMRYKIKNAKT